MLDIGMSEEKKKENMIPPSRRATCTGLSLQLGRKKGYLLADWGSPCNREGRRAILAGGLVLSLQQGREKGNLQADWGSPCSREGRRATCRQTGTLPAAGKGERLLAGGLGPSLQQGREKG